MFYLSAILVFKDWLCKLALPGLLATWQQRILTLLTVSKIYWGWFSFQKIWAIKYKEKRWNFILLYCLDFIPGYILMLWNFFHLYVWMYLNIFESKIGPIYSSIFCFSFLTFLYKFSVSLMIFKVDFWHCFCFALWQNWSMLVSKKLINYINT